MTMAFCTDFVSLSRSVRLGYRRANALDVDADGTVLNIAGNVEIVGETNDGVFCRLFRQNVLDPCMFGFPRETDTLLTLTLRRWFSSARIPSLSQILALPTVGSIGASSARWALIPRSSHPSYWVSLFQMSSFSASSFPPR